MSLGTVRGEELGAFDGDELGISDGALLCVSGGLSERSLLGCLLGL